MADTRKIGRCRECCDFHPLSKRGLCRWCGWDLMQEANRQLKAREGPIYEKYLRNWQASQEEVLA